MGIFSFAHASKLPTLILAELGSSLHGRERGLVASIFDVIISLILRSLLGRELSAPRGVRVRAEHKPV